MLDIMSLASRVLNHQWKYQADIDLFLSKKIFNDKKRRELILNCYDPITVSVKYDFFYTSLQLDLLQKFLLIILSRLSGFEQTNSSLNPSWCIGNSALIYKAIRGLHK